MHEKKKFMLPTQSKLMKQIARVKTTNKLGYTIALICGLAICGAFAFSGMSNAVVQDDDNALTNKLKPKLDLSTNDEDIKPKNIALSTNVNKSNDDAYIKQVLADEARQRQILLQDNQNYSNENLTDKNIYEAPTRVVVNNYKDKDKDLNTSSNLPLIPNLEQSNIPIPNFPTMPDIAGITSNSDANIQTKKEKFTKKSGNFDYLDSELQKSRSELEIKAGTVIPAILANSINSDLPGMINAIVSEDVYDSISHTNIIIPKGTKINGIYDSNLSFGQNGLATVWNRLVFNDGSTFDIGAMTGADQSGNSGFRDKVNNHYGRTFGSAILVAIIGSGMQLSQPKGRSNSINDAQETITANIAQQTGNTAQAVLNKTLNVQPTINIRAGYRFNIMVNKDFVLQI